MKATENKAGEKMHVYEVGYILLPSIAENNVTDEVTAIRGMLESHDATIITEEFPKLRTLAYTMERSLESKKQKYNEGYFGWIKFEMPVAGIATVAQELDKKQSVLRYLIVKTVRENTLYGNKLVTKKEGEEGVVEGEVIAPVEEKKSEKGEMDKSIDALVIS